MTTFTREDFEMAAKAIGLRIGEHPKAFKNGQAWLVDADGKLVATCWAPLDDDGDAQRLSMEAKICVMFGYCLDDAPIVQCGPDYDRFNWQAWPQYPAFPDSRAATREAIFRAAIAIGRAMP